MAIRHGGFPEIWRKSERVGFDYQKLQGRFANDPATRASQGQVKGKVNEEGEEQAPFYVEFYVSRSERHRGFVH